MGVLEESKMKTTDASRKRFKKQKQKQTMFWRLSAKNQPTKKPLTQQQQNRDPEHLAAE